MLISGAAQAGSFDLFGLDGQYQLQGTYSAAWRLEDPHNGIINTPPSPEIPIPDYIKFPESNNFDDGDRNFKKGAMVNNRLSLLGELQLSYGDYGILVRGDAFYDGVYFDTNDNDSPGSINRTDGDPNFEFEGQVNEFSDIARYRSGRRARLLDAYAYGSWYLGDESVLNLRLGRHIAAWGESLFFSGVALAQSPADATKASVPGADVKSILLPVNQISMQLALNNEWTLLGQYKLEYQPVELNPVGEFFSVSDVVGPGAQFIYGIENPLYLASFSDVDILSDDLGEALTLINDLLLPGAPTGPIVDLAAGVLDLLGLVPGDLPLPTNILAPLQPNAPRYINPVRGRDKKPSDHGQWGVGVKYQILPDTNIGLYRLRYHNTTPAPIQNYGYATLLPGINGGPALTTRVLNLQVPVTYNITYFDGIDLTAMSFSTSLFGANVAGEVGWREGVDVLVDVDGGILGPVPTPTRADAGYALLSALYVIGPRFFWDSLTLVGEGGFVHVDKTSEACGPTSCTRDLTYTRDASGWALLTMFDKKNVFNGWDLQVPIYLSGIISGQSSVLSGLGSLMGEDDYRGSIGANFTWLQSLQLGVSYNAFFGGKPHFEKRPYQDRDYAAVTVKYSF